MRVTFAALFDAFECADDDCACRRALRAAPASAAKGYQAGTFPFGHAERAMLRGAQALAQGKDEPPSGADLPGDYPLAAVSTPSGAELYFAMLCPTARAAVCGNTDPVDLARAEGGWRLPVQVFAADSGNKLVRLDADRVVPWRHFAQLREWLLDVVADATLQPLARFARLAHAVDELCVEGGIQFAVANGLQPLTPRRFLAFRAHLEARLAACDVKSLATAYGRWLSLVPELDHGPGGPKAVVAALGADFRELVGPWLAPAETALGPAMETYLAVRVFAIPLDKDTTLRRGHAELVEGFAIGMRLALAWAHAAQTLVTPAVLLAAWSLGEAMVADAGKPVPAFARKQGDHDRAPRMADVDMTLAGLA
ncbi:MAG: hypothetical protein FJ100_02760 [Deltaproteobacteria bacterium]|nr:hypothetical protein [Deltaproteobacteria bacterium]